MNRREVLDQICRERVVGLLPAMAAEDLIACAEALRAGGLHCAEIAMTTPSVIAAIERAASALPDFHFGLGTVLDVDTARRGLLAGARFIVTPAPRPDVITLCRRHGIAVICGAFDFADIQMARREAATAVKVYPGELFGPAHLHTVRAAIPDFPLLAIGGVTPATVREFIRAGATAVVAGSSLCAPEILAARNWSAVNEAAVAFRRAAAVETGAVGAS